jgi:hypothetical protein
LGEEKKVSNLIEKLMVSIEMAYYRRTPKELARVPVLVKKSRQNPSFHPDFTKVRRGQYLPRQLTDPPTIPTRSKYRHAQGNPERAWPKTYFWLRYISKIIRAALRCHVIKMPRQPIRWCQPYIYGKLLTSSTTYSNMIPIRHDLAAL